MSTNLYYDKIVDKWAKEAESVVRSWPNFDNFVLAVIKKDWSKSRISSRGGMYKEGPGINIAMHRYAVPKLSIYRFYEYASYDEDKNIGGFFSTDPEHEIAAIVLHEVAHSAQFFAHYEGFKQVDKPHGDSFKIPYFKLRTSLLNNKIPINQKQLETEYNNIINKWRISNNGLSIVKKSSVV